MPLLAAWIGQHDLDAARRNDSADSGPIARALEERAFPHVLLLSNYPAAKVAAYLDWLAVRSPAKIHHTPVSLASPMDFGGIYRAAVGELDRLLARFKTRPSLTFHISPGTPAMAAVWIILAKTRYAAELIQSSKQHGVETASVPFELSAELLPDLLREADRRLAETTAGGFEAPAEFSAIIHRSAVMQSLIAYARRAALRSVPVLIEGESGTGKELLARAIAQASPRRDRPFKVVNCGAIPADLVEAELFGHEKGAFTGAASARDGYFLAADGGTLFLDEIGELPPAAQVKLLRVLQEGQVTRLGSHTPQPVDVRIIAATNRDLMAEAAAGRFREDLFYRLAVVVLKVPPLRERQGDLGRLIDHLLDRIHAACAGEPGWKRKKLSPSARNLLLQHAWPGNVRELENTLYRAAIWSESDTITGDDVRQCLFSFNRRGSADGLLDQPVEAGVDLPGMMARLARHYLERGLAATNRNKSQTAKLLGLPSYQTLSNWMEKYGVE
jgi:DNA-binding NtrC family response regulator